MPFVPSAEELAEFLDRRPNQGRWGPDDQLGTMNLVTAEKVVEAAGMVRTGERISLSRPMPVAPAVNNPRPALHFMMRNDRHHHPDAGSATDFYGMAYHGQSYTHLDALCHQWDRNGMWGGRHPDEHITSSGATTNGVEHWSHGFLTRGVLLDVPRHRGAPYVTARVPVHGDELREIATAQGVKVRPGDLLAVHCGREAFDRDEPRPWGTKRAGEAPGDPNGESRGGLHASCLWYFQEVDCALLAWDMLDHKPFGYPLPFTVHGAIFSLGMALIDNALLEPLADRCHQIGRYDFMVAVSPLVVEGGTGSPVNPVAVF